MFRRSAYVATIGYHASHEQFAPGELLGYLQEAEAAGFGAAMCSDHFLPWSERQGASGFAWAWLGAALQATSLPLGVFNAPGYRYHPAIIAQACATLADMFPGRFWVAVGSGEALNEHITGEVWPAKAERNERLRECVEVMRALWTGASVSHYGRVTVSEARLYTRPAEPPPVFGGAITPETAYWLAGWADGLITVNQPEPKLRRVVEAFHAGGGAGKPMALQVKLSYAETDAAAREAAFEQWRTNIFPSGVLAELRTVEQFDAAAEFVRPEDMDGHVRISADLGRHLAWLQEDLALGFEHLYLHNVGREQRAFIESFGERVLPQLARS
jgi:coenzyme F420-dependent glucose-6-phosphate dehydrogenase